MACTTQNSADKRSVKMDVQGHRGARGLMPENTIPAFMKALSLGVTTLELDLAVTKDHQLVVSHEPYMGAHICLDSLGNEIEDEKSHNIYQMSYHQVATYDAGMKVNSRFPNQEKMKVAKPLLHDLIHAVEDYEYEHKLSPVRYNIEIKSDPRGDSTFHPSPAVYSKLVYDFLITHMDLSLVNIQSFDFRVLQYFQTHYPEIELAALVENERSIDENLEDLGFSPEIYSCYFPLLDSQKVAYLQSKGIKVIPWTVNEPKEIAEMMRIGVDGIISDYPNRVFEIISK